MGTIDSDDIPLELRFPPNGYVDLCCLVLWSMPCFPRKFLPASIKLAREPHIILEQVQMPQISSAWYRLDHQPVVISNSSVPKQQGLGQISGTVAFLLAT